MVTVPRVGRTLRYGLHYAPAYSGCYVSYHLNAYSSNLAMDSDVDIDKEGNLPADSSRSGPLRHVVIGVGAGVLGMHRPALRLETVDLVAVSDINAELTEQRAEELGCTFYTDHRTMLAETQPDVAVIRTAQLFRAPIAIDCLEAGCHVLVEKPMAVHVAEADAMIEAAARADRLLAVSLQQRRRPEVRAARKLILEGQLGTVQHVDMAVAWTRTARYFELAPWRATWSGEGGGVLLNQAPHNLDLLCHLIGMPSRVVAWTRTLLHQIETEDTAQAMLEWPGGALGSVHISTAEAGRQERLEVLGTGGYLQVRRGELILQRFDTDLREHIVENPEPYSAPELQPATVELETDTVGHLAIYQNLYEAILRGAPLIADGIAGRMSLGLANAMIYSSYTRQEVELPLDRDEYRALLDELKARSPTKRPGS
ncbi:MAG: Myo-inositol 2-dehydrogenase [Anaerolineales bacterium]|nr:Myo-inositol 2-dehydrogenase [Anaerolineales bacterium]